MPPQIKVIDDDPDLEYPDSPMIGDIRSSTSKAFAYPVKATTLASQTTSDVVPAVNTVVLSPWTHRTYGPKGPYNTDKPWPGEQTGSHTDVPTPFSWVTSAQTSAWGEHEQSTVTETLSPSTDGAARPSMTWVSYGPGGPGRYEAKDPMGGGGVLAATAITPIIVLALIGGCVFLCMRKRKRQKLEREVVQKQVQQMTMRTRYQTSAQPYIAPAPAASAGHLMPPSNPSVPPPIILGPIPSGANGAYFTGIDTSDAISMTCANNAMSAQRHLSDNDSLTEPPPPYRPRSVAPPSLTNTSRHSSVRSYVAPPATSQTQLIERSPFDDPEDDDDVVSELSGPAAGRSEDAMSAVSDMSYQNDPVVNRSSI